MFSKMKFSGLFYLLMVALLWVSWGCQKEVSEVGLELQDDSLVYTHYTDTITVESYVMQMDTVPSYNLGYLFAGYMQEPATQNKIYTESFAALTFYVNQDSVDFLDTQKKKGTYDSMFLKLYVQEVFGDTTQSQVIEIYRLKSSMDSSRYHTRSDAQLYDPIPIASAVYPQDMDTAGVMHFRINDQLGKEIFAKGGTPDLISHYAFNKYFKGICIKPKTNNDLILRFDVGFRTDHKASGMTLNWHYNAKKANGQDSIALQSLNMGFNWRYYRLVNDASQSPYLYGVSPATPLNSNLLQNKITLQSGLGYMVRLHFPHLAKMFKDKNIIINRAVLSIQAEKEDNDIYKLAPPPLLGFFRYDPTTGKIRTDATKTDLAIAIDGTNKAANFSFKSRPYSYADVRITDHIQYILTNTSKYGNGDIILKPAPLAVSLNRLVLNDNKHSSPQIKLKVYYTKVTE